MPQNPSPNHDCICFMTNTNIYVLKLRVTNTIYCLIINFLIEYNNVSLNSIVNQYV